jgi:hypothetical protein
VTANLLNREFTHPLRIRLGHRTSPIVLDPYDREVEGWPLKPRMTVDSVTGALAMA